MDCSGKKIIVTGGSEGYGYGIAKKLKAEGAEVTITGRRLPLLQQAAKTLGVHCVQSDVSKPADWDNLFAAVGAVDVLVNNAGAGIKVAPLAEYTDEEIDRSIGTNLSGVLYGCRRAAKIMAARQSGLIINLTSVCAHYGWPGFVAYTAAKAGLDMASRCLYTELRPFNVRVTVVTPSWGATNWDKAAHCDDPYDAELEAKKMQPAEMGGLIASIVEFPDHLMFPEVMVQPLAQEIIPF